MSKPPRILSIAGSDSSGGAGIQADIKTITMLGGYAMTAITAVTAQDTTVVHQVVSIDRDTVARQITACLNDIGADAIKIGMLGSPEVARLVAELLDGFAGPIVFDPVMVATSGSALSDQPTVAAFGSLMGIATVVTPNMPELSVLAGREIEAAEEVIEAAATLAERHDTSVLAKGGHGSGEEVIDRLVMPHGKVASFAHARIDTKHTHGTGCTLSAAIATLLGHGQILSNAVRLARQYTYAAIEKAPGFGAGNGPLGHQAVRSLDQDSSS